MKGMNECSLELRECFTLAFCEMDLLVTKASRILKK